MSAADFLTLIRHHLTPETAVWADQLIGEQP